MDAPLRTIDVAAYDVPTEEVESDGTLVWDKTTVVVVFAEAGGRGEWATLMPILQLHAL